MSIADVWGWTLIYIHPHSGNKAKAAKTCDKAERAGHDTRLWEYSGGKDGKCGKDNMWYSRVK